jgi:hypothetical protein
MKNEALREKMKEVYRPLKRGFEYNGTVHSFEFLQGRRLANNRLSNITSNIRESAFNLYDLGFISDEELDKYRDLCDKLDRFVIVGVQKLKEKEIETVGLDEFYGREYDFFDDDNPIKKEYTRDAYIAEYTGDSFEEFFRQQGREELEDMLKYYNKL